MKKLNNIKKITNTKSEDFLLNVM